MAKIKEKGAGNINNASNIDDGGHGFAIAMDKLGISGEIVRCRGPYHAYCTPAPTIVKIRAYLINVQLDFASLLL